MNLKSKADYYIKEKTEWLAKHDIKVIIDKTSEVIYEDGCGVGGMFNAYTQNLSCAAGGNIKHWLPIFMHEFQHAKQFINQSSVWLDVCNLYKGEDALGVIFNWLDGKEYPDSVVYRAIRLTQAIELDAEKKTVREMINTGISNNIDVLKYTKEANAYIYSYNLIYMTRTWVDASDDSSLANKTMPDHFNNDYTKLPMEFYRQHLKYSTKEKSKPI